MTTDESTATVPTAAEADRTSARRLTRRARWGTVLASAAALTVTSVGPASAAECGLPEPTFCLPAGQACPDFPLSLLVTGGNLITREFTDQEGEVVRVLQAGDGFDLTFTNVSTGKQLTVSTHGSVSRTTLNPDGTATVESTGHNLIILFPTDDPPGPSTILYTGRIVYTVAPGDVFTVQSVSGKQRDICAELDT